MMEVPSLETIQCALVTPGPDADAGMLPRSLDVIFSSIDERVFTRMSIKPHRCREFTRLTWEQQAEEAAFKRSFFRQIKEVTRLSEAAVEVQTSNRSGSMLASQQVQSLISVYMGVI